ncbi:unnamed protein product, partial [Sphacelaria rigidula]
TVVWETDIQGALKSSRSENIKSRQRHVSIKFHHVRSAAAEEVVDFRYV